MLINWLVRKETLFVSYKLSTLHVFSRFIQHRWQRKSSAESQNCSFSLMSFSDVSLICYVLNRLWWIHCFGKWTSFCFAFHFICRNFMLHWQQFQSHSLLTSELLSFEMKIDFFIDDSREIEKPTEAIIDCIWRFCNHWKLLFNISRIEWTLNRKVFYFSSLAAAGSGFMRCFAS